MKVEAFLLQRPCLDELDGYLWGLRLQLKHPEIYSIPEYSVIDAEVLGPIEKYRARLKAGKETPNPSRLARGWEYRPKRAPKKKRQPPIERGTDEPNAKSTENRQSKKSKQPYNANRPALDADKGGGRGQRPFRIR